MVVAESAVSTWCGAASSACATDPRLSTPAAAKANVHLFNFISVPPAIVFLLFVLCIALRGENDTPLAPDGVQLRRKIGKSPPVDNKFFDRVELELNLSAAHEVGGRGAHADYGGQSSGVRWLRLQSIYEMTWNRA